MTREKYKSEGNTERQIWKGQKAEHSKKGAKRNRKAIKKIMTNDEVIRDSTVKAGLTLSDEMKITSIY